MRFMSASTLVTTGASISGGMMTGGPYKGLQHIGSIVVDVPINGHFETISDTISFTQSPKMFDHFGDCSHFKISGTAYCPSNNGPIGPPYAPSVFGPAYAQEGVGSCILARTTGSHEIYVHLPGQFSYCDTGEWYFALAARRVGNRVEAIWGNADLEGDRYIYRGFYEFLITEYEELNGVVYQRSTGLQQPIRLQTQDIRPFDAFEKCKVELYDLLSKAGWEAVRRTYSANSISIPNLTSLSPKQVFPDMRVDWGELAADAYSSVPFFSSNGIAYSKDLIDLKKSATTTLSLLTSLASGGKLATKAANLFLSFYYGWRLMMSDSEELVRAYSKAASLRSNRCKATSRRTWEAHGASYVATLQCFYLRYARSSSLDEFILANDLALTPENLWDLVPFSFVIDWFTGIGNVLEDASNYYNLMQKHEVLCTGRSIKATKHIPAGKLSSRLSGELIITHYERWYTPGPVNPTFHFSNSVNPLDHAVEGTALIVSRR